MSVATFTDADIDLEVQRRCNFNQRFNRQIHFLTPEEFAQVDLNEFYFMKGWFIPDENLWVIWDIEPYHIIGAAYLAAERGLPFECSSDIDYDYPYNSYGWIRLVYARGDLNLRGRLLESWPVLLAALQPFAQKHPQTTFTLEEQPYFNQMSAFEPRNVHLTIDGDEFKEWKNNLGSPLRWGQLLKIEDPLQRSAVAPTMSVRDLLYSHLQIPEGPEEEVLYSAYANPGFNKEPYATFTHMDLTPEERTQCHFGNEFEVPFYQFTPEELAHLHEHPEFGLSEYSMYKGWYIANEDVFILWTYATELHHMAGGMILARERGLDTGRECEFVLDYALLAEHGWFRVAIDRDNLYLTGMVLEYFPQLLQAVTPYAQAHPDGRIGFEELSLNKYGDFEKVRMQALAEKGFSVDDWYNWATALSQAAYKRAGVFGLEDPLDRSEIAPPQMTVRQILRGHLDIPEGPEEEPLYSYYENPPWAEKILKKNWEALQEWIAAQGYPPSAMLPSGGGQSSGPEKDSELGCGHYGCVYQLDRSNVVFKLTTDESEATFVGITKQLQAEGQMLPQGVVRYYDIVALPETHRKRPVFALWREEAFSVGMSGIGWGTTPTWFEPFGEAHGGVDSDYVKRLYREASELLAKLKNVAGAFRDIAKRHRKKKDDDEYWAWVDEQWAVMENRWNGIYDRGAEWVVNYRYEDRNDIFSKWWDQKTKAGFYLGVCSMIMETMANTNGVHVIGQAMYDYFNDHRLLMADVHENNLGNVQRNEDEDPDFQPDVPVITDPGHVVALDRKWAQVSISGLTEVSTL